MLHLFGSQNNKIWCESVQSPTNNRKSSIYETSKNFKTFPTKNLDRACDTRLVVANLVTPDQDFYLEMFKNSWKLHICASAISLDNIHIHDIQWWHWNLMISSQNTLDLLVAFKQYVSLDTYFMLCLISYQCKS